MSIATVITRGFGSFGSVNKLPTLGYSTGAEVGPLCFDVATFTPGATETYFHRPGPSHAKTFVPGAEQTKPGCDCG